MANETTKFDLIVKILNWAMFFAGILVAIPTTRDVTLAAGVFISISALVAWHFNEKSSSRKMILLARVDEHLLNAVNDRQLTSEQISKIREILSRHPSTIAFEFVGDREPTAFFRQFEKVFTDAKWTKGSLSSGSHHDWIGLQINKCSQNDSGDVIAHALTKAGIQFSVDNTSNVEVTTLRIGYRPTAIAS